MWLQQLVGVRTTSDAAATPSSQPSTTRRRREVAKNGADAPKKSKSGFSGAPKYSASGVLTAQKMP